MTSRLHWTRDEWREYFMNDDQAFWVRCYAQHDRISEAEAIERMISTAILNQRLSQYKVTAPSYNRRQFYEAQDYRILRGKQP